MIFETQRLSIRMLSIQDTEDFFDMMGNPNVMNPIPQKVMTRLESDMVLEKFIPPQTTDLDKQVWAIVEKESTSFIGLCAFLKNNKNDEEIAYRLREQFWGVGYGTEIAKGLIGFGFTEMSLSKITADVNITNTNSTKILDKFMSPVLEFYNNDDQCTDRRYELYKENWYKL